MRNWITFLMTFLASVSCANANIYDGDVSFEAGYRHDNINWSAKVPSDHPLFKSTTKYKDLDIFQLGVNGRGNVGCNLYVRGAADFGWVLDGNHEKTFQIFEQNVSACDGIASTDIVQKTKNTNIVDGRYVFDVSGALGYQFFFCNCSMALSPVVGYSFSEQNLWVESNDNLRVVHSSGRNFEIEAANDCCRDKLISRWYGPFIGLDWEYEPYGECWNLFAQLEYHWAHQQTKKHSLTGVDSFDNFKSTSRHAHGWVFAFGFDYQTNSCWTVGLSVKAQDWRATRSHREGLSDYSSDVSSGRRHLRHNTNWNSYAINLRVGREF